MCVCVCVSLCVSVCAFALCARVLCVSKRLLVSLLWKGVCFVFSQRVGTFDREKREEEEKELIRSFIVLIAPIRESMAGQVRVTPTNPTQTASVMIEPTIIFLLLSGY